MLTLSGIRKTFGGRVLFDDATLQVNRGLRIGLVGPNGAGKTTLFSIKKTWGDTVAETATVSPHVFFQARLKACAGGKTGRYWSAASGSRCVRCSWKNWRRPGSTD